MTPSLCVYFGLRPVGRLEWRDERMHFSYEASWRESPDAFAVSLSLPLDGNWDARHATRFFANLLPEANIRTLVCRRLGLSETNDFGLLAAIGGECAGALSILPEDRDPSQQANEYEEIEPTRLLQLATSYEALPTVDGSGRARLSLAGAQDKLPVRIDEGRILLPIGNSPSSHILKLPNRNFKHLPANETLVMELARWVKLPVVSTRWHPMGSEGICVVERYDRVRVGDEIRRIHQEDFCQAMGLSVHAKYEDEGGPSLARCIELLRRHSVMPLADVDALLRWMAFNAMAGNADGHGKNVSMVLRDGLRLAPFYDLVCTRAYKAIDRRLAMSVGGERDPDRLRGPHLDVCAQSLDIKPRLLRVTFEKMAESILNSLPLAVASAAVDGSPAVERTVPNIRKQAQRWLRELREGMV